MPPPTLPMRQPPSPSYSPVMHILGRPLQYLVFSFVTFWVTLFSIRMTHNKPNLAAMFQNTSYPIVIGIVSFNFLLSVFLCVYYLLNIIFFGKHPTMPEHTVIVEKLFNFFSFKIVLVGMVIEPDIFDFFVWYAWYAVLASMKAILHYGQLRLIVIVDSNTATASSYIRPFFHLVFGFFFVTTGLYYWKVLLRTTGHVGLSMLVLFDLVTLFVELVQSTSLYTTCILKAHTEAGTEIESNPATSTSTSTSALSADFGSRDSAFNSTANTENHKSLKRILLSVLSSKRAILFISSLTTRYTPKCFEEWKLWAKKTDFVEFQTTVELYSDIVILSISLVHYCHVCTINGLSLSLVDIFLFLNIWTTCNFLLQKLHTLLVSQMAKSNIDRVFPDYNIALRDITRAKAIKEANIERKRKEEIIYRSSFIGVTNRIFNGIVPSFNISRFFKTKKESKLGSNLDGISEILMTSSPEKAQGKETEKELDTITEEEQQKLKRREDEKTKEDGEEVCSICLDNLLCKPCKMLPCGHAIHSQCLKVLVVKTSVESTGEVRGRERGRAEGHTNIGASGEVPFSFPLPRYIMGSGRPFLLPPNHPQRANTAINHQSFFGRLNFVLSRMFSSEYPSVIPFPTAHNNNAIFKCPMCRCDISTCTGALIVKNESEQGSARGSAGRGNSTRVFDRRSNASWFNDLFRGGSGYHDIRTNIVGSSRYRPPVSPSPSSSSSLPSSPLNSLTSPSPISPITTSSTHSDRALHPPQNPHPHSLSESTQHTTSSSSSNPSAVTIDAQTRLSFSAQVQVEGPLRMRRGVMSRSGTIH